MPKRRTAPSPDTRTGPPCAARESIQPFRWRWRRRWRSRAAVGRRTGRRCRRPPSRDDRAPGSERDLAQFTYRVGRLVLDEDGWRMTVSVTNGSPTAYRLEARSVGLVLLDTRTQAGSADHRQPVSRPAGAEARPRRTAATARASARVRPGARACRGRRSCGRAPSCGCSSGRSRRSSASAARRRTSSGHGSHSIRLHSRGIDSRPRRWSRDERSGTDRTSLSDEEIRTDVAQEIREETADADMDDTDTDDTDSDSDDTDA